jgi:hypothetical protein
MGVKIQIWVKCIFIKFHAKNIKQVKGSPKFMKKQVRQVEKKARINRVKCRFEAFQNV